MATHSSTLAWRISWTEEPGGLQSTGSQRVGREAIQHSTQPTLQLKKSPHPIPYCWKIGKQLKAKTVFSILPFRQPHSHGGQQTKGQETYLKICSSQQSSKTYLEEKKNFVPYDNQELCGCKCVCVCIFHAKPGYVFGRGDLLSSGLRLL